MANLKDLANTAIDIIIGVGVAAFVLGIVYVITVKFATSAASGNTTLANDVIGFFDPIKQYWTLIILLVLLGAGVMVIIPVIRNMRSGITGGAA